MSDLFGWEPKERTDFWEWVLGIGREGGGEDNAKGGHIDWGFTRGQKSIWIVLRIAEFQKRWCRSSGNGGECGCHEEFRNEYRKGIRVVIQEGLEDFCPVDGNKKSGLFRFV